MTKFKNPPPNTLHNMWMNKRIEILNQIKHVDKRTYLALIELVTKLPNQEKVSDTFITGNVGSGKTVHAAWLLLEYFRLHTFNRKSRTFVYSSNNKYFNAIKETYDKDTDIDRVVLLNYINSFKTCDLLILDDIGIKAPTDWAYNELYTLVDYRYKQMKTTIYTSNLSISELSELFNDDRIPSRISHQCKGNIIKFNRKSFR